MPTDALSWGIEISTAAALARLRGVCGCVLDRTTSAAPVAADIAGHRDHRLKCDQTNTLPGRQRPIPSHQASGNVQEYVKIRRCEHTFHAVHFTRDFFNNWSIPFSKGQIGPTDLERGREMHTIEVFVRRSRAPSREQQNVAKVLRGTVPAVALGLCLSVVLILNAEWKGQPGQTVLYTGSSEEDTVDKYIAAAVAVDNNGTYLNASNISAGPEVSPDIMAEVRACAHIRLL